jgi:hypothetical protein
VSTKNARALVFQELLPNRQILSESMKLQYGGSPTLPSPSATDTTSSTTGSRCEHVMLSRGPERPNAVLVDLTGSGVVMLAVPESQVLTVAKKEGYAINKDDRSYTVCLSKNGIQGLIQSTSQMQIANALVQTKAGWQLLSTEQLMSYAPALNGKPSLSANSKKGAANKVGALKAKARHAVGDFFYRKG